MSINPLYPYGDFCGDTDPHIPHSWSLGNCLGLMADDGSNAEWF